MSSVKFVGVMVKLSVPLCKHVHLNHVELDSRLAPPPKQVASSNSFVFVPDPVTLATEIVDLSQSMALVGQSDVIFAGAL